MINFSSIDYSETKALKLQRSLSVIRRVAGWTAEELGNRIGVTRQTISNIEKNALLEHNKLTMSKTQYIAIRAVFAREIYETDNTDLQKVLQHLVDSPMASSDYESLMEQVEQVRVDSTAVRKQASTVALLRGLAAVLGVAFSGYLIPTIALNGIFQEKGKLALKGDEKHE